MKLLLDENLSRRLLPLLQHDYPASNQVVLPGMGQHQTKRYGKGQKPTAMSSSLGMRISRSLPWFGASHQRSFASRP